MGLITGRANESVTYLDDQMSQQLKRITNGNVEM